LEFEIFVAWLMGARFDLAFQELWKGSFRPPEYNPVADAPHGEL